MLYFGEPESGYAVEPGVGHWSGDIEFSYGGQPTEYHPSETRITPEQAFEVVRQLVATDARPTSVDWSEQAGASIDDPMTESRNSADDLWSCPAVGSTPLVP